MKKRRLTGLWFLDLGVAGPPPTGALGVAPRDTLAPLASVHDPFTHYQSRPSPLPYIAAYALAQGIPSWPPIFVPGTSPLLPNPYNLTLYAGEA